MDLKGSVLNVLRALATVLPYGKDLYLKYIQSRYQISYRGVFENYGQAHAAIHRTDEYDLINRAKADKIESGRENLDAWIADHDYPLLFWMAKVAANHKRLVELGGSLGHFYYSSRRFTAYPEQFEWLIAELSEAVELGARLAAEREDKRLRFVSSDRLSEIAGTDFFMTAGTIQYMQSDLVEILQSLVHLPVDLIVHELPVHDSKAFWTLQDLKVCEMPYRVYSKSGLFESLEKLGYEMVDTWSHARTIQIPFHREETVAEYIGFYCRKRS